MQIQAIDSISQFVCSTQHYELDRSIFREKKNRIFSVQEKSKFKNKQHEDNKSQSQYEDQKQFSRQTSKVVVPKMNFILRLNSGVQVSSVANDTLHNFANIIVLDVSNARLNVMPDAVIAQMPLLQVLNLQNNLLSELPMSVNKAFLVQLNVNNNLLRTFHCDVAWQEKLERLDVGKNHLRLLPAGLWQCERLNALDVRSNDFDCISLNILNLENKICAIGLDWVKYSPKQYMPQRNDILRDKSLLTFWLAIKQIIQDLDSINEDLNDSKILKQINCYQFIIIYDELIFRQSFIEVIPDMGDDVSLLYLQEYHVGELRPLGSLSSRSVPFQENLDESNNEFQPHQAKDMLKKRFEKVRVPKINHNLIHMTVINEDLGVLRSLLVNQLNLASQLDEDNHTPLSLSIQEEKYHCAKILLNAQGDVNLGGGPFGSCINLAVSKAQYFLLRDLLSNDANVQAVDAQGNGPLHYLIPLFKKSSMEAIKMAYLLIEAGANPNLKNNNGHTPLQIAVKKSIVQAVKFALQYNYDNGSNVFDFKVQTLKDNHSLLHLACKSESIRNILQIAFIQPYNLFQYNAQGVRPFDQIQKNYTLSKLLQILEGSYIRQTFQTKMRMESILQENLLQRSKSPSANQSMLHVDEQEEVDEQDVVDEGDEYGTTEPQIVQGMASMKLTPKLKRSGSYFQKLIKMKDHMGMEPFSKKKESRNKIPKENINTIHVHKSTQQRNDLKKVECYNKSLMRGQMPSSSATLQSGRQCLALLDSLKKLSHTPHSSLMEYIIVRQAKSILLRELVYIQREDAQKVKAQGIEDILQIHIEAHEDEVSWCGVANNHEAELLMRNTDCPVEVKNTFLQYESLQLVMR